MFETERVRVRIERIRRLETLLRLATEERQKGGWRGGIDADVKRANWEGEWKREFQRLSEKQSLWERREQ